MSRSTDLEMIRPKKKKISKEKKIGKKKLKKKNIQPGNYMVLTFISCHSIILTFFILNCDCEFVCMSMYVYKFRFLWFCWTWDIFYMPSSFPFFLFFFFVCGLWNQKLSHPSRSDSQNWKRLKKKQDEFCTRWVKKQKK